MTPYHKEVLNYGYNLADKVEQATTVFEMPLFEKVMSLGLVQTAEITLDGIELTPMCGDAHLLRKAFEPTLKFSRQLNFDGATYSWVSEFMETLVFIHANEVIDHTGSIVSDPTSQNEITH